MIDQRSNTTTELHFKVLETGSNHFIDLPVTLPTTSYSTTEAITHVIKTNTAFTNVIDVIQKTDFALANISPIFVEVNNYTTGSTLTFVYDTATTNSRAMVFYNAVTSEAKVIDYTKVSKIIEASRTVEKINELGQTNFFTTNTKTITNSEEFKTVFLSATKHISSISTSEIKGVETISNQKGTQYKIITINDGIVNHVVLQSDKVSGEVTFISHGQTSVVSEILAVVPKQEEKVTKLNIQTLKT